MASRVAWGVGCRTTSVIPRGRGSAVSCNGVVYLVIGIKVHADAIFGTQLDIRDALLVRQAQFKLLHSRCVRLHDGCNGSLALVFILPATCEEKGGTGGERAALERALWNAFC